MKQLYHKLLRANEDIMEKFGTDDYTSGSYLQGNYVSTTDICKYCGKSGFELYKEVDVIYKSSFGQSASQQLKWLNKYTKCLTEEEYLIKQIIE